MGWSFGVQEAITKPLGVPGQNRVLLGDVGALYPSAWSRLAGPRKQSAVAKDLAHPERPPTAPTAPVNPSSV
jgi:hypothetical protein